jgi:hypothetical protein
LIASLVRRGTNLTARHEADGAARSRPLGTKPTARHEPDRAARTRPRGTNLTAARTRPLAALAASDSKVNAFSFVLPSAEK